jgi:hypothetical protein
VEIPRILTCPRLFCLPCGFQPKGPGPSLGGASSSFKSVETVWLARCSPEVGRVGSYVSSPGLPYHHHPLGPAEGRAERARGAEDPSPCGPVHQRLHHRGDGLAHRSRAKRRGAGSAVLTSAASQLPMVSAPVRIEPGADALHAGFGGFVRQHIAARDGLDRRRRQFLSVGGEALIHIVPVT